MTSNYVSFSRKAACDPKERFSLPGCPDPSWRRWRHKCYKLVNRDQGQSLEDTRRGCKELGGYLLVMRNDSFKEDTAELAAFLLSLDENQEKIWVDHPLTYGPKGVGMNDSRLSVVKTLILSVSSTR